MNNSRELYDHVIVFYQYAAAREYSMYQVNDEFPNYIIEKCVESMGCELKFI